MYLKLWSCFRKRIGSVCSYPSVEHGGNCDEWVWLSEVVRLWQRRPTKPEISMHVPPTTPHIPKSIPCYRKDSKYNKTKSPEVQTPSNKDGHANRAIGALRTQWFRDFRPLRPQFSHFRLLQLFSKYIVCGAHGALRCCEEGWMAWTSMRVAIRNLKQENFHVEVTNNDTVCISTQPNFP